MRGMNEAGSATVVALVATALLFSTPPAGAAPNGPAEKSLERCQKTVRAEGAKLAQGTQKAVGTCLARIAVEVLKKNAPDVSAAVQACRTQLDRLARTDGKSLPDRFTTRVHAHCDPAPANAHTSDDLLGAPFPGVAEPIGAREAWPLCQRFGVDSVSSAGDWIDCMRGAHQCAAHDALGAQFPRAVEWLGALADALPASPARDAALAVRAAIEGTLQDGRPDGACTVEISAPGCPDALLARTPNEVVVDLRTAVAAEDWDAVACSYHPNAFLIDDQGVLVGPQEIVAAAMALASLAGGAQPVVTEQLPFRDLVRELFTLDAGWWMIGDGTSTYVVRRGRIVQQTTHGLIEFTGPPPDAD